MQSTCQQCGQNEGLVHVSVAAGESRETYALCASCAQKFGIHMNQQHSPTVNDLYQSLLPGSNRLRRRMDETRCRQCGTSFGDIRRTGQVGCPSCYGIFARGIRQLLRVGDSHVGYTGRLPGRVDALRRIFVTREHLREQLQEAVRDEDFESAARIREEIRRIERDSGGTHHE